MSAAKSVRDVPDEAAISLVENVPSLAPVLSASQGAILWWPAGYLAVLKKMSAFLKKSPADATLVSVVDCHYFDD